MGIAEITGAYNRGNFIELLKSAIGQSKTLNDVVSFMKYLLQINITQYICYFIIMIKAVYLPYI